MPIIYRRDTQTNLALLKHINGLVIPGGKLDADYDRFVSEIYQAAKKMNDDGNYFPVWGIGLGALEMVNEEVPVDFEVLVERSMDHSKTTLEFVQAPEETKMWGYIGKKSYNFTANKFSYFDTSLGVDPIVFAHAP